MALSDINLEIKEGEIVGLIGANGSGKSTLLYILGGLDKPSSGQVSVAGQNLLGFNDDEMATVIGSVKGTQLEGKNLEYLEEYTCNTIEEADSNLHKFIQRFVRFKIIGD